MAAKTVQVYLDTELLKKIDADAETLQKGAVEFYFRAKARCGIDDRIGRAYQGRSQSMLDEIYELLHKQAWPDWRP